MESRTEMVVNAVIEKGLTSSVAQLVAISAFASVQYGYNIWVCYSDTDLVKQFYNITYHKKQVSIKQEDQLFESLVLGLAISLFPIGGMVGALFLSLLMNKFGRKGALMINNYFSVLFSMSMVCATQLRAFAFAMISRFLIGISMGIFSSGVSMYLLEISPVKLRGAIGMVPHLFMVLGVQVGQIFSFPEMMGTIEGWPMLVSFAGILAVFQIILLPSNPESPRYLLIQKKEEEEARQALKKLRLQDNVEDEMEEIRQEELYQVSVGAEEEMDCLQLMAYDKLRWQVISIIVLVTSQQMSGVNVVYIYAEKVYSSAGLSKENVKYFRILTNFLMIIAILFGMFIVDTKGRKFLLLVGFGTSAVLCVLITLAMNFQVTFAWLSLVNSALINIYLIVHAMGPSTVVNLLIGELFLQSTRSSAYVTGEIFYWLLNRFTVLMFRYIEVYIGSYSLLIASPINIAAFFYILKMVPETKGKTFLEIHKLVLIYTAKNTLVAQQQNTKHVTWLNPEVLVASGTPRPPSFSVPNHPSQRAPTTPLESDGKLSVDPRKHPQQLESQGAIQPQPPPSDASG